MDKMNKLLKSAKCRKSFDRIALFSLKHKIRLYLTKSFKSYIID